MVLLAAVGERDGAVDRGQLRVGSQHRQVLGARFRRLPFLEERIRPGQELGAVVALHHQCERQVSGDQGHAQPAAALVLAEQHHRGAIGAGELREKFGLADE